jgi:hypothetical protein
MQEQLKTRPIPAQNESKKQNLTSFFSDLSDDMGMKGLGCLVEKLSSKTRNVLVSRRSTTATCKLSSQLYLVIIFNSIHSTKHEEKPTN